MEKNPECFRKFVINFLSDNFDKINLDKIQDDFEKKLTLNYLKRLCKEDYYNCIWIFTEVFHWATKGRKSLSDCYAVHKEEDGKYCVVYKIGDIYYGLYIEHLPYICEIHKVEPKFKQVMYF